MEERENLSRRKENLDIIDGTDNDVALINTLCDDCLTKIFTFLPTDKRLEMELVCTRWRDLSQLGWHDTKKLILSKPEPYNNHVQYLKIQMYIKKLLMRCGQYLTTLELKNICDSKMIPVIWHYCHNLIKLVLVLTNYERENMVGAFSNMPKLKYFEFEGNQRGSIEDSIESISENIEEIHLIQRPVNQSTSLSALERFDVLRVLTLHGFCLGRDTMEVVCQKTTLIHLNLPYCDIIEGMDLISNLKNLERLNLFLVRNPLNGLVTSLANECKKLKHLNLNFCVGVTEHDLLELAKSGNLEELSMNWIDFTDIDIDTAISKFQKLKKLGCHYCSNITDAGVTGLLENSQNLEELKISKTSVTELSIECAIAVTRYRTNDLLLELTIDQDLYNKFNHEKNTSPFLTIKNY